jgi:DNA-binding CsgD family transcriptional regulator
VFAGWSLEMAERVCSDQRIPADGVLDLLAALVDKSLVVREPEVLGQARYRLLDTIREYAADKLAAAGETAVFQRRLRDYVLAVVERNFAVGMALIPAQWQDRVDVFRRYDADASNVWLVLSQCLADGDVRAGLRICTAVRPCLLVRGEFALGSGWLDAFLARDEAADVDPAIRGAALIGRAQFTLSSDPAGAEPLARDGLGMCRAAGDDFWTAAGLNLLSEIAVHTGRLEEAEALGREAVSIAEAAGDAWNQGWAFGIRAAVAGLRGRLREAADLANASVGVMRGIDHLWGVARAQLGLGDLARAREDYADARQRYTEALACLREIDARPEIARCLSGLGRVAMDLGATALAREHLAESLRLSRTIGTRVGVARGLESFAALAAREEDPEQAVLLTAASTALRDAGGLPPLPGARAERYLAPARRLGDQAVARLWTRGLALSAEAAIGLALQPPAAPAEVTAAPDAPAQVTADDAPPAAPPSSLTPRELEIAALVTDGYSNKAIAEELVISPATVARHVANIMIKLGFRSRAQIAAWTADRRPALPLGAGFVDGQFGGRVGLQPLVGYRLAAEHRPAVRAGLQPGKRPVDRRQPILEVRGDGIFVSLLGQRQRLVPIVASSPLLWPGIECFFFFFSDLPQQRRHLVALREQHRPRPAFVHISLLQWSRRAPVIRSPRPDSKTYPVGMPRHYRKLNPPSDGRTYRTPPACSEQLGSQFHGQIGTKRVRKWRFGILSHQNRPAMRDGLAPRPPRSGTAKPTGHTSHLGTARPCDAHDQPQESFRPWLKSRGTITSAGTRSRTDERPRASRAESMPPRRMSKTFRTPAGPPAARPHRQARPIITARAPRASAFTTSPPRRTPPSSSTSARPATASATQGSARIAAGVPSRLLPPWLDTEIAVAPAPTARRASSGRMTPLTMKGPSHRSRNQAMSSQAGGGTVVHER